MPCCGLSRDSPTLHGCASPRPPPDGCSGNPPSWMGAMGVLPPPSQMGVLPATVSGDPPPWMWRWQGCSPEGAGIPTPVALGLCCVTGRSQGHGRCALSGSWALGRGRSPGSRGRGCLWRRCPGQPRRSEAGWRAAAAGLETVRRYGALTGLPAVSPTVGHLSRAQGGGEGACLPVGPAGGSERLKRWEQKGRKVESGAGEELRDLPPPGTPALLFKQARG